LGARTLIVGSGLFRLQALKIAENALNALEQLERVRPTKSSFLGLAAGRLLAKSAYIEAELRLTGQDCDEQTLLTVSQVGSTVVDFLYPVRNLFGISNRATLCVSAAIAVVACLSVIRRYCIKTDKNIIRLFSQPCSPTTMVF